MWIFKVNDLQLQLINEGKVLYNEPGVACLDRKAGDTFGDLAFDQLFKFPRQRLSTAWQAMNQESCHQRGKNIRSNSDAIGNQILDVFTPHLRDIGSEGWVVVPSDMSETQLGLLYGILEYAKLKPLGFLKSTVACSNRQVGTSPFYFVELYLHRTVVSQVSPHEQGIVETRSTTLTQTGYLEFIERWLHRLSTRYLDTSRFDLHVSGDTEQQAVNQIRNASLLEVSEVQFEIEHNEVANQLTLPVSEITDSTEDFLERISKECASGDLIVLGSQASQIPGLVQHLESSGFQVEANTQESEAETIEQQVAGFKSGDEVSLHEYFPSLDPKKVEATEGQTDPIPSHASPTHLLEEVRAFPLGLPHELKVIDDCVGTLSQSNGSLVLNPTGIGIVRVNERISTDSVNVSAGDRLLIQNEKGEVRELTLICVEERG